MAVVVREKHFNKLEDVIINLLLLVWGQYEELRNWSVAVLATIMFFITVISRAPIQGYHAKCCLNLGENSPY